MKFDNLANIREGESIAFSILLFFFIISLNGY